MEVWVDTFGQRYQGYEEIMSGTTQIHSNSCLAESGIPPTQPRSPRLVYKAGINRNGKGALDYANELGSAGLTAKGSARTCGMIHISTNSFQVFITIYPDDFHKLPPLPLETSGRVTLFNRVVVFEAVMDFEMEGNKARVPSTNPTLAPVHRTLVPEVSLSEVVSRELVPVSQTETLNDDSLTLAKIDLNSSQLQLQQDLVVLSQAFLTQQNEQAKVNKRMLRSLQQITDDMGPIRTQLAKLAVRRSDSTPDSPLSRTISPCSEDKEPTSDISMDNRSDVFGDDVLDRINSAPSLQETDNLAEQQAEGLVTSWRVDVSPTVETITKAQAAVGDFPLNKTFLVRASALNPPFNQVPKVLEHINPAHCWYEAQVTGLRHRLAPSQHAHKIELLRIKHTTERVPSWLVENGRWIVDNPTEQRTILTKVNYIHFMNQAKDTPTPTKMGKIPVRHSGNKRKSSTLDNTLTREVDTEKTGADSAVNSSTQEQNG
jgi:hypothetical protein